MGFTKLWNDIILSSIWREDDKTRIVWITLLAISDSEGFASCSIPGLAAAANVRVEDCRKAIEKLASPDPYSRCKDFDGRRIDSVDGGFLILNYIDYRNRQGRDDTKRRDYMRDYMRKKRAGKSKDVKMSHVSREAEAEAETNTEYNINSVKTEEVSNKEDIKSLDEQFEEFRKIYPGSKRGLEVEFGDFQRKHKNWREFVPLLMPAAIAQRERRRAAAAAGKFVPEWKNLKTWLNQSCWTEECGSPPEIPGNSPGLGRTPEQEAKILKEAQDAFFRQMENGGKQ